MANHSLRRAYATAATNAGVDEDTVGKPLNHGGRSVTVRYIKTSYLGRMLAAAQEDISAHLAKALGAPHGKAKSRWGRLARGDCTYDVGKNHQRYPGVLDNIAAALPLHA